MEIRFEIKVTHRDMYNFLMHHTYRSFSGIFSVVAGIALLGLFWYGRTLGTENTWLYLLFGVLFLVYEPWTLLIQSAKQVSSNPVFQKPLSYCLTETGISVAQGETENEIPWTAVTKVRESARSFFIYTSKRNASIWVKDQLGGQEQAVREILERQVPERARGKARR